MAEALIELYQKEGLASQVAEGYRLAAYAYNAAGYKENAVVMARIAMEYGLYTWKDSVKLQDTSLLLSDPEGHWAWKQRV